MDFVVQAALMLKMEKVFAGEDTFLSFPVSPLPFKPEELVLDGDATPEEARRSLHNLQAFSTLVNLLPEGEAWVPDEAAYLWDVYARILQEGDFATSTRTPAEEEEYRAAQTVLRRQEPDGSWSDTIAVRAYRQWKDAFLLAQQRYEAARLTLETADGSDAASSLQALRLELAEIEQSWLLKGFRVEVESAQARVMSLGARSPLLTWAEWKSRFNRDLDTVTGAADLSVAYGSFYSPVNALDENAWKPFELGTQEIAALLGSAPEDIKAKIAEAGNTTPNTSSVSFEFSSAVVTRPWFAADALRSRFWRFSDGSLISDGTLDGTGICPAYVTALVFARKVVVKHPATTIVTGPFKGIPFAMARRKSLHRITEGLPPSLLVTTAAMRINSNRLAISRTGLQTTAAFNPTSMRLQEIAKPDQLLKALSASKWNVEAPRPITAAQTPAMLKNVLMRRDLSAFKRLDLGRQLPVAAPEKSSAPADPTIFVLAFVCKRVSRCPDPDPALQW